MAIEGEQVSRDLAQLTQWLPISTAPKETDIIVGRFVRGQWIVCVSGFYFDSGNPINGEPPCWFWSSDFDACGITEGEGPTHWLPIPITEPSVIDGGE